MKPFYSLFEILKPTAAEDDPRGLRKRSLRILLLGMAISGLLGLFWIIPSAIVRQDWLLLVCYCIGLVITISFLWLRQAPDWFTSAYALLALLTLGGALLAINGVTVPSLLILLTFILFSTILYSRLAGLLAWLASILVMAAVGGLRLYSILPALPTPITDADFTLGWWAAAAVLSMAAIIFTVSLGTLLDSLQSSGVKYRQISKDLQDQINVSNNRLAERSDEMAIEKDKNIRKAAQLKSVSEIALEIAPLSDLEQSMEQIVRLIGSRMSFAHVAIYLNDENQEYTVLRGASSEAGRQMLAGHNQIKIGGNSLIGAVVQSGQARISSHTSPDEESAPNLTLPGSLSEIALPLKVNDKVIGALDAQSDQQDSFSIDDIALLSLLAEQVAIVIENNRLYSGLRRDLTEAQDVYLRYLHHEWNKETVDQGVKIYRYTSEGIEAGSDLALPEIREAINKGEIVAVNAPQSAEAQGSAARSALAIPIKFRDLVIGVIDLQEQSAGHIWTKEEISMAQAVADQVAQALENARLIEQTARRAEREQKVLEITSKIRSTNDPQAMIQTAVEELKKALKAKAAQIILTDSAGAGQDSQSDQPQDKPDLIRNVNP